MQEALDFLKEIDSSASKKLTYNIEKVKLGVKDTEVFKKLTGTNIWEFRTIHCGNCYRLLSFWDARTNTLIVATHGFVKKSDKTPKREIDKAEMLRKEYFEDK